MIPLICQGSFTVPIMALFCTYANRSKLNNTHCLVMYSVLMGYLNVIKEWVRVQSTGLSLCLKKSRLLMDALKAALFSYLRSYRQTWGEIRKVLLLFMIAASSTDAAPVINYTVYLMGLWLSSFYILNGYYLLSVVANIIKVISGLWTWFALHISLHLKTTKFDFTFILGFQQAVKS